MFALNGKVHVVVYCGETLSWTGSWGRIVSWKVDEVVQGRVVRVDWTRVSEGIRVKKSKVMMKSQVILEAAMLKMLSVGWGAM